MRRLLLRLVSFFRRSGPVRLHDGAAQPGPGFPAGTFLTAKVLMDEDVPATARARQYWRDFDARYEQRVRELAARLAAEPTVAAVTTTTSGPGVESTTTIEVEGTSDRAGAVTRHNVRGASVGVDFFGVFDVPLLAGRPFAAADVDTASAVIVNETFVRDVLAGGDALGRRIRFASREQFRGTAAGPAERWHEIVGVVADLPANPVVPGEVESRIYEPWRSSRCS